ncbi:hypothetical protein L7F22_035859 [Adiantum nelumboides]|nr:hypothetical protein [Adiantum nelumboides]
MVQRIGEYGSGYVPPSSEALRTTLLDREKVIVEQATLNIQRLWAKHGVSLIADGCSDTRKRSIHGFVAYSSGEMYFVHSHDATESGKSADVLSAEWSAAIETIGAEHVVAFIKDGVCGSPRRTSIA